MGTKSTLLGFGLGQLLSVSLTFTGFACSQLARKGVDAPFSQCLLGYLLLAFVYGGIMIHRGQPLRAKSHNYIVLALFDVLSHLFVVKAYKHSSLTSVNLLSCWTLPFVLAFNWLFLKTKYGFHSLVGFIICFAGFVAIVLSDVHSADRSSGINPLRGDLLIIVGATLIGVTNIFEEIFLKRADSTEIMTFLGIYGAILSASQIVINERNELKSILSSPGTMFLLIGYSLAIFFVFTGFPLLFKISGPIMLNMSFFTASMWPVLIQIFVYHEKVDWIYFVCLAAVTLGYILIFYPGRDEMDPNNGEPATKPATIHEAFLNHSDNDEISNNDGSSPFSAIQIMTGSPTMTASTSFREARNLLCYISCIIKIQEGDVRGDVKEV